MLVKESQQIMSIVDCISYYIKIMSKKQLKNGIYLEKLPIFRHLQDRFLYVEYI